jgi:hypothetical protein
MTDLTVTIPETLTLKRCLQWVDGPTSIPTS